jgi:hypothetical protein
MNLSPRARIMLCPVVGCRITSFLSRYISEGGVEGFSRDRYFFGGPDFLGSSSGYFSVRIPCGCETRRSDKVTTNTGIESRCDRADRL